MTRMSRSRAAVAYRSRASTTLLSSPSLIRWTAVATARCHSGAVRLPSCHLISAGAVSGARGGPAGSPVAAGGAAAAVRGRIVVSQDLPPRRPTIVSGTMSTEPSEVESKVKLPKATGPVPGSATRSSTSAPSKSSRSHFSPAVNLSSPAGSVILAVSPHPARPSTWRIQATPVGSGKRATRSPGTGISTVRTARCSVACWESMSMGVTTRTTLRRRRCHSAGGSARSVPADTREKRGACGEGYRTIPALEQRELLRDGRRGARPAFCGRREPPGPAARRAPGRAAPDAVAPGKRADLLAHPLLVGGRGVGATAVEGAVAGHQARVRLGEPAEEPLPRTGAQVQHDRRDRGRTGLRDLPHRGLELCRGIGQE